MSIISGVKTYMQTCPYLQEFTDEAYVDFTSDTPGNYGIMPMGEQRLKRYLRGRGEQWQYSFALYAKNFTFEDLQRIENCEFLEHLTDWVSEQDKNKNFPDIGTGKTARSITCSGGMLFDTEKNGDNGLYQIQLQLIYDK
jgi:hypothetical protein